MADPLPVRLSVPAQSKYVRLARLTAAGVAADAGFDVEDVEDLRVAVSELFALLVDDTEDPSASVDLEFTLEGPDAVSVTGRRSGAGPAPQPRDLALEILRVVVDEHEFRVDGGDRRFSLRKRASAA